MFSQTEIVISTSGRGTYEISRQIEDFVGSAGIATGICHIFIRHTSASLMLCENADPAVLRDLEAFMGRQVPDGDPMFTHTQKGRMTCPHMSEASSLIQTSICRSLMVVVLWEPGRGSICGNTDTRRISGR